MKNKTKIHFGVGGYVNHYRNKKTESEFTTLCGRKFETSENMESGFLGAENTNCKRCKKLLTNQK